MLAWSGDDLVGVATYVVSGTACELLTLHATDAARRAPAPRLLAAVRGVAGARRCTRLWVVTTNDNVDALRFYQRRGFRLARLAAAGRSTRAGETLKPEIPTSGAHGIPLRDELELEMELR